MRIKNKVFLGVLLCIVTVGIYLGIDLLNSDKSKNNYNIAASVKYDNIEEISKNAELIIKGQINDGYREFNRKLDNKLVNEKIYKVEVKDILVDKTGQDIENGSIIEVSYAVSFEIEGSKYDIVDLKDLSNGEYLLFLNTVSMDNEIIFVNNSPNNIYRLDGDKFTNLVEETKMEMLTENDLLKLKK